MGIRAHMLSINYGKKMLIKIIIKVKLKVSQEVQNLKQFDQNDGWKLGENGEVELLTRSDDDGDQK